MRCGPCTDDLEHCHGVSVAHADGTTQCLGDDGGPCQLPHALHEWRMPCTMLDPPCPCEPEEHPGHVAGVVLLAAA